MKMLIRVVAVGFVSLCLMLKANATGEATLSGTVRDAAGKPLQGAEIRIQGNDANKIGKIHTGANGHYSYPALETGTYNVTLAIAGITKASINNVRTTAGENQTLNFDLQKAKPTRPALQGKHYVWIPSQTGSHLGTWVEVDDDAKAMSTGMEERMRWSGNALARHIQTNGGDGNRH
jgi:protocatechuate 3,4-dioxygenase beta subunit